MFGSNCIQFKLWPRVALIAAATAVIGASAAVWRSRSTEAVPSPAPPPAATSRQPPLCRPGATATDASANTSRPTTAEQTESLAPGLAAQLTWTLPSCYVQSYAAGFSAFTGTRRSADAPAETLVVVAGQYTDATRGDIGTLLAVNADGVVRWHVTLAYPAISAPVLVKRPGASPLVVIASYFGRLTAVDLHRGSVVWELKRPLNVYTPAILGDTDGDGVDDLLVTEGGDQFKGVDEARPHGSILAVSGQTGRVFAQLELPSGDESYMPPLLVGPPSDRRVVFGSGGETDPGSLYLAPLDSVLSGRWDDVVEVAESSGDYGWIGLPTTVGSGTDQKIVAVDLGGMVVQFDLDGKPTWTTQLASGSDVDRFTPAAKPAAPVSRDSARSPTLPSPTATTESGDPYAADQPVSYVGPVTGDFDCDGDDDVLASRIRGSLSDTLDRTYAVLDASTGKIIDARSTIGGGHAVPLVADFNGDSCDQAVIYLGEDARLAEWDLGSPQVTLPATARAGVTPVLVPAADAASSTSSSGTSALFTFGCDVAPTASKAQHRADGLGRDPDPALAPCRLDLEVRGPVRSGSFTGSG